jgi:glycogen phosphorylase
MATTHTTKKSPDGIFPRLDRLARNLWWSWNPAAQRLFAAVDPLIWEATRQNPLKTIAQVAPERRAVLEQDASFRARLQECEHAFEAYLASGTWFDRKHKKSRNAVIAYFCAEFAVHECLPQYAGGLGVLAGDHVKSASDLGVPLVGVGLLYRSGYYTQEIKADGSTRVIYPQLNFADHPVHDTKKIISVPMAARRVKAKIWQQRVGRVSLYLLDTDIPGNSPKDRKLTKHLYGGDREYRIQQEMLLGVGGLIALETMGIHPTVFHLNEGHAAFCALERVRRFFKAGKSLDAAVEKVRRSTVFTTHTPVPAGNDRFVPALAWKYLAKTAADLGLERDELLALGREDPSNKKEEFCMSVLALNLAAHCNGVAALHGETSRRMWTKVYGVDDPKLVPIGHITNGIHPQTWLAPEMLPLYEKYLKPRWLGAGPDDNWWKNAHKIPPEKFWAARNMLRRRMIGFIRNRLTNHLVKQNAPARDLAAVHETLRDDALTIGFARRFATYKRAPLVFHNIKRLASILNAEDRPVQLIFAGKAHPADTGGQGFAQEIYQHAHKNGFRGKVILLEDYDMQMGRMLTSGCDVWLNNPLRPQEASGTSGMKPPLHGGVNCSILDGWWPEAHDGKNGWAIGDGREFAKQSQQDAYDAQSIYDLLEQKIVPLYYRRDSAGIPHGWVTMMAHSMETVCAQFSTHRMVSDYVEKYYLPAHGGNVTE